MMNAIAQDMMSTELLTVYEDCSLEEALKLLVNNRITGLPVVNREQKMVGIISEYDILKQIFSYEKLNPEIFKEKITFSKSVKSVQENATLAEVMAMFMGEPFRRLPVVNQEGRLVGIITRRDLIRIFYYRAKLSG